MLQHFHILFPFPFLNNSLLSYWVGVTEESYSHERVAGGGCWSPSRLRCAHLWGVGVEVPHFWCPKFSSSHVWMCELDHKEGCVLKNWCFWTVVLENFLKSPLDSKAIKPVNHKGNQPWILIGGMDAEAPILWSPGMKSQFTGKDPDAGKDWKEKVERMR